MTKFAKPNSGSYKGKPLQIVGYKMHIGSPNETISNSKQSGHNAVVLMTPNRYRVSYWLNQVEFVKEELKVSTNPKVDKSEEMFLTLYPNYNMYTDIFSSYQNALKYVTNYFKNNDEEEEEIYIYKLVKVISSKTKKTVEIIESDPIE